MEKDYDNKTERGALGRATKTPGWKEMNYKRSFFKDSVGDKFKNVKNIAVRNSPQFMFKKAKTNDIMFMEQAQEIMDKIAEDLKLKDIFSADNVLINDVVDKMEDRVKEGKPGAAETIAKVGEQVDKQDDPAASAQNDDELGEDMANLFDEEKAQQEEQAEQEAAQKEDEMFQDMQEIMSGGITEEDRAVRQKQAERAAKKANAGKTADISKDMQAMFNPEEVAAQKAAKEAAIQKKIADGKKVAEQRKAAKEAAGSADDDFGADMQSMFDEDKAVKEQADKRLHRQRASRKANPAKEMDMSADLQQMFDPEGYAAEKDAALQSKIEAGRQAKAAQKAQDAAQEPVDDDYGEAMQNLFAEEEAPAAEPAFQTTREKASAMRHMQKDANKTTAGDIYDYASTGVGLLSTGLDQGEGIAKKILGEDNELAEKIGMGTGIASAGVGLTKDAMDIGKKWHETRKDFANQDNMDRMESVLGFGEEAGSVTSNILSLTGSITGNDDLQVYGKAAEKAGKAVSEAGTFTSSQYHMHKIRQQEKNTKLNKTFHKDKAMGETSIQAARRVQKEKAEDAYNRHLAQNPGDRKGAQQAKREAQRSEASTQAKYIRHRNAEHMAKSMRSDKRNRSAFGFVSNMLGGAGKLVSAILGPKTLGGRIANWAGTGLSAAVGGIGGLIADHLQGKAMVKTIDNEIKALKVGGGPAAGALAEYDGYDDLKKRFKFEYMMRTKDMDPKLRDLPDSDFKTLMSNALSGHSGGKNGLANSIAEGRAQGIADSENPDEGLMKAMGLRMHKDENGNLVKPSAETIASRMAQGGEAKKGEYTAHQYADKVTPPKPTQ